MNFQLAGPGFRAAGSKTLPLFGEFQGLADISSDIPANQNGNLEAESFFGNRRRSDYIKRISSVTFPEQLQSMSNGVPNFTVPFVFCGWKDKFNIPINPPILSGPLMLRSILPACVVAQ
jgi:hypothetical protein